jgi:imidazolonepropionase-like amidohydrolase
MPPAELLRSATAVNAELIGRPGVLGVVAPGAMADVIVVDGDPLHDLTLLQGQGEHLRLIMKAGTVYKDDLRNASH